MPGPPQPVSRPWRRFLRLSVRGLIVLIIVIGIALGWTIHAARLHHDAVTAINRAVRVLSLTSTRVSDAGLARIKKMTNLQTLYLRQSGVTKAGVQDLKRALPKTTIFHR
jgi:hypothetical protein